MQPADAAAPRRARVYDRLEGQEPLPQAPQRFAQVDAAAQSLRPGAVVALSSECDELLAVRRSDGGAWTLATQATDWSSRGATGWHTHACDYAVESLEPHCLFRVLRDGRRLALASLGADGHLLCASAGGERLGVAPCRSGESWGQAGAAWEQRDGAIYNVRWPDKVLAVRLLHVTCLPTLQLQRCEEYYGALLHELHAEKAALQRAAKEAEEQRDAANLEARRWQHQAEELEAQVQLLEQAPGVAVAVGAALAPTPSAGPAGSGESDSAVQQLAVLQQQLESLAEGGLPALQQERARMSICLQTIKEITDLVRRSGSATPSATSSPGHHDEPAPVPAAAAAAAAAQQAPAPFATDTEGESRLRDYLGSRPEEQDPLARVLGPDLAPPFEPDSTPQRVLRALENAPSSSIDPDSAPPSSLKGAAPPARAHRPLSLSLAVETLAAGSPRQADGVAQYLATKGTSLGQRGGGRGGKGQPLSASDPQPVGHRLRSSFLQRPPAVDIYNY